MNELWAIRGVKSGRGAGRLASFFTLAATCFSAACSGGGASAPADSGPGSDSDSEPFTGCDFAQPSWGGNAAITDVESLAALAGYERISGSLVIDGTALEDLRGLESLRCVVGDLYVVNNGGLESLRGLENLREVGGLYIEYCPSLTDLHGLDRLESIQHELSVAACDGLTSLGGLVSLRAAGRVSVRENPAIVDLSALSGLTALPEGLEIHYNSQLASLAGLDSVQGETAALVVSDNHALESLAPLSGLSACVGDARVTGSPLLVDLVGLGGLEHVGGELWIDGDDGLASLAGLENLTSIGALVVGVNGLLVGKGSPMYEGEGNAGLIDLSGLDGLVALGDLEVVRNDALASLHGLEGVAEIPDGVWIDANPLLTSLAGLDSLESIGVELVIGPDYFGTSLEQPWVGAGNPDLVELGALANLFHVGVWVAIRDDAALPTCAAAEVCARLDAAPADGCCIQANLADSCADETAGCPSP